MKYYCPSHVLYIHTHASVRAHTHTHTLVVGRIVHFCDPDHTGSVSRKIRSFRSFRSFIILSERGGTRYRMNNDASFSRSQSVPCLFRFFTHSNQSMHMRATREGERKAPAKGFTEWTLPITTSSDLACLLIQIFLDLSYR